MSQQFIGTVQRRGLGIGAWALVTEAEVYELKNAPEELRQAHMQVKVTGKINKNIMTLAMIGPVLEVESFEVVS
ncbi:MAG: hypothetical protein HC916_17085 [Coleofasciculaceae cyanobacterium SM2_1_6]|nr:hypothetical protein [Coleofasciculaceae cyanobacterium SM2_1_6]